jgi:hypothetical protein
MMQKIVLPLIFTSILISCGGPIGALGGVSESCSQYRTNTNWFFIKNSHTSSVSNNIWPGSAGKCAGLQASVSSQSQQSNTTVSGVLVSQDIDQSFAPKGGTLHFDASPLMAIKLSPSTTVYFSGYPVGKQSELGTWLNANQPALLAALGAATPLPTQSTMDRYGLYYLLDNAGKASLGMPTNTPDRVDAYTSLDPSNRAYDPNGFVINFTVNGPTATDVLITFTAMPR